MIQALVFDFDGVILETEGPIYTSWQELYHAHGQELALEQWLKNIGTAEEVFNPITDLERRIGRALNRSTELLHRRERELELIYTQPVLPGVADYLKSARARGLKIGLASSSPCSWVTSHLERLELIEYFDVIAAGDDVPRTKPDPALYWTALSWLGVQPEHAIAFEDSYNGMLAAKRAGLRCVVVPHALTRHMNFDLADLRLDSLADLSLEDLLSHFNGRLVS